MLQTSWSAHLLSKPGEPGISEGIGNDQRRPACRVPQVEPSRLPDNLVARRMNTRLNGSASYAAQIGVAKLIRAAGHVRLRKEKPFDLHGQRGLLQYLTANAGFSGFLSLTAATRRQPERRAIPLDRPQEQNVMVLDNRCLIPD